jgi:hypothetical protein
MLDLIGANQQILHVNDAHTDSFSCKSFDLHGSRNETKEKRLEDHPQDANHLLHRVLQPQTFHTENNINN